MKNTIKFKIALMALSILFFQGCIEEPPSIGESFDRVSGLSGNWQLQKIIQNDEDAIRKGFPSFVQSVDVTDILPFTDFAMTLNTDESGQPTSFSITNGTAPNFINTDGGNWELDDPVVPSTISFQDGEVLDIENYLGLSEGIMNLKLTRYQTNSKGEKVAFLSYQYEFLKQ